ncbi:molybdopterin-dependent oxidoreductase [Chelativorans sp. Marseille-P2723]|uniref:molybdopterin-dependent oxidoreductase n=1 Tax=Chelativorans sp. Marseille-P2723 TaxID=2709133 RepID=UPI001AEDF160|nr:molybdopterin-dependent oxidoreductase [Chelativorans sp. Marseille-P2723]
MRPIFLSMLFSGLLIVAQWATAAVSASFPELQGEAILEVRGTIKKTNKDGVALFDMAMLQALPIMRLETSTAVTDGVHLFEGFLMRDLLAYVGAEGETVTATALNNYAIDFDIREFERFDVLIAYRMDGAPLLSSDKGPLWIVYPRDQHPELQDIRYDYRWVWQLTRLDIR